MFVGMGGVKQGENLKRQEDPSWGSNLQAEESYLRVQGACLQKEGKQVINLVLSYE